MMSNLQIEVVVDRGATYKVEAAVRVVLRASKTGRVISTCVHAEARCIGRIVSGDRITRDADDATAVGHGKHAASSDTAIRLAVEDLLKKLG